MSTQSCLTAIKNLGLPNCLSVADITKQLVLVNYYKADGTVNGIDLATLPAGVLTPTVWGALINSLSAADRFYLTPKLNLVTDVREDEVTEDVGGGVSIPVRQGARTFEGHIVKGDPTLLGNIEDWKGKTVGGFFIDKSGNVIGNGATDGYLYPIRLEKDTFFSTLVKGTDDAVQKVRIKFQISELELDKNIGMIESSMITADVSNSRGLVDVVSDSTGSISTTGFDVELITLFGGVTSKITADGLATADFYVYNETQAALVAATVVENVGDTLNYSFTYAAQVAGDVLRIGNKITGTLDKGFDIETFYIAIPT